MPRTSIFVLGQEGPSASASARLSTLPSLAALAPTSPTWARNDGRRSRSQPITNIGLNCTRTELFLCTTWLVQGARAVVASRPFSRPARQRRRRARSRARPKNDMRGYIFPVRHFYGVESRNNNFMTILRRQATKRQRQNVTSLARFGNETGAPATSLSPLHLIAMLVIRLH